MCNLIEIAWERVGHESRHKSRQTLEPTNRIRSQVFLLRFNVREREAESGKKWWRTCENENQIKWFFSSRASSTKTEKPFLRKRERDTDRYEKEPWASDWQAGKQASRILSHTHITLSCLSILTGVGNQVLVSVCVCERERVSECSTTQAARVLCRGTYVWILMVCRR